MAKRPRKGSKKSAVQYGKSYRYGSTEAAIKDLAKLEKKQHEVKAAAVDKFGTPIPPEVQKLASRFVGKRVLIRGDHPHAGKAGTVDRAEMARALRQWGFVVALDDYSECFVFKGEEWRVIE
jgi:hypothetical protein